MNTRKILLGTVAAVAAIGASLALAGPASAASGASDMHNVTVRADFDGAVSLPSLNKNFPTMTLDVNGSAQWGATPDGYEPGFAVGDRDGSMTSTYTHNVALHNRQWTIGQAGAQGSGTPADWWYRGADKTAGPAQAGALLIRTNGGAWREFNPTTDATLTLPKGATSMTVDVAFNDHAGWYAPNTISPAGLDEGNYGQYDVTIKRTKA